MNDFLLRFFGLSVGRRSQARKLHALLQESKVSGLEVGPSCFLKISSYKRLQRGEIDALKARLHMSLKSKG